MSMMVLIAAVSKFAAFALWWGKAFIFLSFVGAVLTLVALAVDAYVKFVKRKELSAQAKSAATDFLTGLSKVLEALGKLPAWIAMFLAGLALLWLSGQP